MTNTVYPKENKVTFETRNAKYLCAECGAYDITVRGRICNQCVHAANTNEQALKTIKRELQEAA